MSAASIATLERVAEHLPQEQRERFLALIATFKQVPEDDEYLLTLEAIGFMTLLWQDVPKQITEILAGAQPAKAPTNENLSKCVQQAVKEAITLPSHEDLRRLVEQLWEQETKFIRAMKGVSDRPPQSGSHDGGFLLFGGFLGFVAAIIAIFVIVPKLRSYLPDRHENHTIMGELSRAQGSCLYSNLEDRVLCQSR